MALSPTCSARDAPSVPHGMASDTPLSHTAAPSSPIPRSRSPWRHNNDGGSGKGCRGAFASPASSPRRSSTPYGMQSAPASPFLGFAANLSPLATRMPAGARTPVFPRLGGSQGAALDAAAIAAATAAAFPPSQPPSATPSPTRRHSHRHLFLTSPSGNSRGSGMGLGAIDGGIEGGGGDDGIPMAITMGLGLSSMSVPMAPDSPGRFPIRANKDLFQQVCLSGNFGGSLPSSPMRPLLGSGMVGEQFEGMAESGQLHFGGGAATPLSQQLLSAGAAASAAGLAAAVGDGGYAPAGTFPLGGAFRMDFGHLGFVVDSGRATGGGGGDSGVGGGGGSGSVTGKTNATVPLNASKRLCEQLVSDPNLEIEKGTQDAGEDSKRGIKKARNGSVVAQGVTPKAAVRSRSATIAAKRAAVGSSGNGGRLGGGRSDDSFESDGSSSGGDSYSDEEDNETAVNRQGKRLHPNTAALLLPLPPTPRPLPWAAMAAAPRAVASSDRSGRKLAGSTAAARRKKKKNSATTGRLQQSSVASREEEAEAREHTLARLDIMSSRKDTPLSPAAAAGAALTMALAPPPPTPPLLPTIELTAAPGKAARGRAAASNVHVSGGGSGIQQRSSKAAKLDVQLRSPPRSTRSGSVSSSGQAEAVAAAAAAAHSRTPRDRRSRGSSGSGGGGSGSPTAAAGGGAVSDLACSMDFQTPEPAISTLPRPLLGASPSDTLAERRRNSARDYAAAAAALSAAAISAVSGGVMPAVTAGESGSFDGPGSGGEAVERTCNCRKSRCLKLYCDCFAGNALCRSECKCRQCLNTPQFETERQQAVRVALERNPNAFQGKKMHTGAGGAASVAHNTGCNCKKSSCLKRYCECYQLGLRCGERCKCSNCHNYHGSAELAKSQQSAATHAATSRLKAAAAAAEEAATATAAFPAFAAGTAAVAGAATREAGIGAAAVAGPIATGLPAQPAAATAVAAPLAVATAIAAAARAQYSAATAAAPNAASTVPSTAAKIMASPQPAAARSSAPALRSSAATHRTRPPLPATSTPLPPPRLRASPRTSPRGSRSRGGSSSGSIAAAPVGDSGGSMLAKLGAAGARCIRRDNPREVLAHGGPSLPVFGAALPAVDKLVALTVLAYLDGEDLYSAALVSPLWSGLAFDDAMWQQQQQQQEA